MIRIRCSDSENISAYSAYSTCGFGKYKRMRNKCLYKRIFCMICNRMANSNFNPYIAFVAFKKTVCRSHEFNRNRNRGIKHKNLNASPCFYRNTRHRAHQVLLILIEFDDLSTEWECGDGWWDRPRLQLSRAIVPEIGQQWYFWCSPI